MDDNSHTQLGRFQRRWPDHLGPSAFSLVRIQSYSVIYVPRAFFKCELVVHILITSNFFLVVFVVVVVVIVVIVVDAIVAVVNNAMSLSLKLSLSLLNESIALNDWQLREIL